MDLKQLSQDYVDDAKALLAAHRWAAAYYLAGYSVECGLKACVINRVHQTGILFESKKFANDCFTHELDDLIDLADLRIDLEKESGTNPALATNWALTKDWSVQARYHPKSEQLAKELSAAIFDTINGVLPWIQKHW